MTTAEPADFISLDVGALRNYLANRKTGPVCDAMSRFPAGTADADDRLLLGNWAATHGDAFPRTCETLARELDRTASK